MMLPVVSLSRLADGLLLPVADRTALDDLYARGTPENTRRAYAADLAYLAAWKAAAFGQDLVWPETEPVALRFILDHARDLSALSPEDPARLVADRLVAAGLRRSLAAPAPATLDRRIASWRAMHRMRNLSSPFDAPLIRQARARARKAAARRPLPKSARPITRDVLEAMLSATGPGMAGLRDRAILAFGFASGGRRRSEIAGIAREDVDLAAFDAAGQVWISLPGTRRRGWFSRGGRRGWSWPGSMQEASGKARSSGVFRAPERCSRGGSVLPGSARSSSGISRQLASGPISPRRMDCARAF